MSPKPYLLIAGFFLSVTAGAQFSKGDRMIGASIASATFTSGNGNITVSQIGSNTSKVTNYNFSLTPSMGWFVSGNTVVGATVNINPFGTKTTYSQDGSTYQSDKSNSYNIGFGGFARSYFGHSSSTLPFAQASLNGGFSNLKTDGFFYGGSGPTAYKITYSGNSSSGSFFNASLVAGLTKMMGEQVGIDLFAGYTFSYNKNVFNKTTLRDNGNDGSIDETLKNETTSKYTTNGVILGLGVQVFLKKKK